VFTPLYGALILRQSCKTFYRRVVPIILATLATVGFSRLLLWRWSITNWVELGTAATAVTLLFAAITYRLLTQVERLAVKDLIVRWRK
jgi:hypothetical protein